MPNINAALLCAQIENLEFFIENKRNLSDLYCEFFSDNDNVILVREIKDSRSNYWLNTLLLKDLVERDNYLNYLNDQNIMSRPVWNLINNLDMYKKCPKSDLSNSMWLENRLINIPSSVC